MTGRPVPKRSRRYNSETQRASHHHFSNEGWWDISRSADLSSNPVGNWYANISMWGVTQDDVLGALRELGRTAFVSPKKRGYVVIYDSSCRRMDGDDSEALASELTRRFNTVALIALNADDDELWLCAYRSGEKVGEFLSSSPSRSGALAICRVFNRSPSIPIIWVVLNGPFLFEVWRHMALCKLLGLPEKECMYGYPGEDDGRLIWEPDPLGFRGTRDD